jgi:hypothetical protein
VKVGYYENKDRKKDTMGQKRDKQIRRIAMLCIAHNAKKKPAQVSEARWYNHIMRLTKDIYKALPWNKRAKFISQFPLGAVNPCLRR